MLMSFVSLNLHDAPERAIQALICDRGIPLLGVTMSPKNDPDSTGSTRKTGVGEGGVFFM
jgi:hypothetical protein